ncbi:hypothetical protein LJC31_02865 [Synergistaceae bacterium OttesenSCG-928-I11]|nr:hypothetical protein [Synergistaceae bacterium OttesenSCG-928-I11]
MKKFAPFFWITCIIITLMTLSASRVCAAEPTLPDFLRWGMDKDACERAFLENGFERAQAILPELSGDRTIRNFALVRGVREFAYARKNKNFTETVSIRLFHDELFRVLIDYADFKTGFRDDVVREVTKKMSSAPRRMHGANSGMDIYMWIDGDAEATFTHRELPGIDLHFSQVDWCHGPTVAELKRIGLQ